jgi:hypothetical protein
MRLYVFRSDAQSELRAFVGDATGSKLPDQFRPWHAVGVIGPEKAPPHNLPRDQIEKAIEASRFQLWRVKPKASVA